MDLYDLRRLAVFVSVVDHASFSAAADELHLSQPAVSQAIARLERDARVPLLVRDRAGTVPTQAGRLLTQHARRLLSLARLASQQLAGFADDQAPPFRMGAYSSAMSALLPAVLAELAAVDPYDGRIETREGPVDTLIEAVASGQLDAAIGYDDTGRPADTGNLGRTDLFEESLELAVGPDHPYAGRDLVDITDLVEERWLTPGPEHLVVRACRAAGFEPQITAQARDVLAIRSLILVTGVVSLTPESLRPALAPVHTVPLRTRVARRVFAVTPDPPTTQSRALLTALVGGTASRSGRS